MANDRGAGRPPTRLILHKGVTVLLNGARFTLTLEGRQWRLITQKKPYDARWNVLIGVAKPNTVTVSEDKSQ